MNFTLHTKRNSWAYRAVICAILVGAGIIAKANVNTGACGKRQGNEQAFDFCMSLTDGGSSNPVAGGGGSNPPPAKDPIKPIRPNNWPEPATIPGSKQSEDNSQYRAGGFAPPRVAKPTGAYARGCEAPAIKRRCGSNAACLQRVQTACDEGRP